MLGKVTHARGDGDFAEERIERDIGIRTGDVDKADTFVCYQSLHRWRAPRRNDECHIDLTGKQLFGGRLWLEREQLGHLLVQAVAFEQFERERARTAARRPD